MIMYQNIGKVLVGAFGAILLMTIFMLFREKPLDQKTALKQTNTIPVTNTKGQNTDSR